MRVGYARTSTVDQQAGLDAQLAELERLGCTKLFHEQVSSVAGFTHQRSKVERYAKSGNFRASSVLRKAGRVARIGVTGATTSDLSCLTRYGRRSGVREPAGG